MRITIPVTRLLALFAFIFTISPPISTGQEIKLLKDIRPDGGSENNGSPYALTRVGNEIYFGANKSNKGVGLWKSDGTEDGTVLVKQIGSVFFYPQISSLVEFNGKLAFIANDSIHGIELWISDGTEQGTFMVKDIYEGAGSSAPGYLTSYNGFLFFAATDASNGRKLWRSDGTEAGTEIMDISSSAVQTGPTFLTIFKNKLYFIGDANSTTGEVPIWSSNGTLTGTKVMTKVPARPFGPLVRYLVPGDNVLYFVANNNSGKFHLWKSDGTNAGTAPLTESTLPDGLNTLPTYYTTLGDRLLFSAYSPYEGHELWTSDGTSAGTHLLMDINPGKTSSSPRLYTRLGSNIYFMATTSTTGGELWRTDGTLAGTTLVKDINPGFSDGVISYSIPIAFKNRLYFGGRNQEGSELWTSDGTSAGTYLVKKADPGARVSIDPRNFAALDDALLFTGFDYTKGNELWITDGTEVGTGMLKDIDNSPGHSSPVFLNEFKNDLYFSATDNDHGKELWRHNTELDSTYMVKDIVTTFPYSSTPGDFRPSKSRLFFRAQNENEKYVLMATDGTTSGTVEVSIPPIDNFDIRSRMPYMTTTDSTLFYDWQALDGSRALYKVAGKSSQLMETFPNGTIPSTFVAGHDRIFFKLRTYISNPPTEEIWISDGTPDGTKATGILAEYDTSLLTNMFTSGNRLLFFKQKGINQFLYGSDGTPEGTVLLQNFQDMPFAISMFQGPEEKVYFMVQRTGEDPEWWESDGTLAGTRMVLRFDKLAPSAFPLTPTIAGNKLYFAATSITSGFDLWVSDGTEEGTRLVQNFGIDHQGFFPQPMTSIDTFLYFTMYTAEAGIELWRSDGSREGTDLVGDLFPGTISSQPIDLKSIGRRLYFSANHPDYGREVFYVEEPEIVDQDTALPWHSEPPFTLFPNPVDDELQVQFPGQQANTTYTITIRNTVGQIVTETTESTEILIPISIPVDHLASGIYILQLSNGLTGKFIKQ